MLAIAGGVALAGYLLLTFGLSQFAGQNYCIADLAIPGKFTLGNPAPDGPANTQTGGGKPTQPGTGQPNPTPTTPGATIPGLTVCINSKGQTITVHNSKCPKGYQPSATRGNVGGV